MTICNYCEKKLKTVNSLSGHLSKCEKYQNLLNSIITEEYLNDMYKNGFTSNEIAKDVSDKVGRPVKASSIIHRAKKFCIKSPTCSESANLSMSRRINTNISKYGAINVLSKGTDIYKKRNNTVKDKYGVDNVFQLESTKTKIYETMIDRYGVSHTIYMDSYNRNTGNMSIPHLLVSNYLSNNNITHTNEHNYDFKKFNNELNSYYCPRPDILIESHKVVIEIYGDNWHANPKKYLPNDLINTWKGTLTAKQINEFDAIRKRHIESFGFTVIELWVSDITHNFSGVDKVIKTTLNI